MVILVILIGLLLSVACIYVSNAVVSNMLEAEYLESTDSLAATVAVSVPAEPLASVSAKAMQIYRTAGKEGDDGDYAEQFMHLTVEEDYMAVEKSLRSIQYVSEADSVYIVMLLPEEKSVLYIADAGGEDTSPGRIEYLEESVHTYLSDPQSGIPAHITDTPEYGRTAAACVPVYDDEGRIICYAAAELGMSDVLGKESRFLMTLGMTLMVMTAIICIFAIIYVRVRIVRPINMLSDAAKKYGQNRGGAKSAFSSLDIRTGDELEILLHSMINMEKDIETYVKNLTQTRKQLSSARQHADDMQKQAYRDSLTGIRNRLAYDNEISRIDADLADGNTRFGIAMIDLNILKSINDSYGHERGNTAIVTLSRLICDIFAHSPVFRIGGDEFAVILRNNDYNNIESLTAEFDGRIAELSADTSREPWERISAALGYALYREGDTCADDVFKRADYNMYERKKSMKHIG